MELATYRFVEGSLMMQLSALRLKASGWREVCFRVVLNKSGISASDAKAVM
ncbi:hypothetical protein GRI69_11725 [Erythrobacter vulgaris]|uniref:Uncharacterized protein n=1 Tax=Qipengyuania vulgaris TaxID=291985 RepID=A0A844XTK4_9SPHN|nr:hypothetical protein [Qipengyuania vulgaris]MXO48926.1 hypothetical protein [Qipengyuania vulgaris]